MFAWRAATVGDDLVPLAPNYVQTVEEGVFTQHATCWSHCPPISGMIIPFQT